MADGGRLLAGDADDEARDVDEVHHRQMEGLGEVDEARDLVAGVGGPAAPTEGRIGRRPPPPQKKSGPLAAPATAQPSGRASPVPPDRPHILPISKKLPRSTQASTI